MDDAQTSEVVPDLATVNVDHETVYADRVPRNEQLLTIPLL
jgi:hypothetical protein